MKRVAVVLALVAAGCTRSERYESAVQVVRKELVEKADDGVTTQIDFEVEWDACPGDQFQVLRGDRAFATCASKYEVGEYVPVVVKHYWDDLGYYRWDIDRFGDCPRTIEPDSQGSYEKSAECKDINQHGKLVGFECNRKPFRSLLKRCPWMARD